MIYQLVGTLGLLGSYAAGASAPSSTAKSGTNLLYTWVGSDSGDHVATIDYNPKSGTYGQVLHRSFLPTDSPTVAFTGNEAHHLAITGDGRYLVTAGLTSFLQQKDEIFVWEIDQKTKLPKFKSSYDIPGFACPDEFVPLDADRSVFLISMMCNEKGDSPGSIFQIDVAKGKVSPWQRGEVTDAQTLGFNPHGFDFHPKYGVLSADYVKPASLFIKDFVFRTTSRHFNADGTFNGTIQFPTEGAGAGYMEMHFFPSPPSKSHFAVTCSTTGDVMFRVNALDHNDVIELINLADIYNDGTPILSAGLQVFSRTGNRLLMTFGLRYVVLFGFNEERTKIEVLQSFDFCTDLKQKQAQAVDFKAVCNATNNMPGSHYVRMGVNEDSVVVTNYFVTVGNARLQGSKTIHAFKTRKNPSTGEIEGFTYDYKLASDVFETPSPKDGTVSEGRPHGVVQGVWDSDGAFASYWPGVPRN